MTTTTSFKTVLISDVVRAKSLQVRAKLDAGTIHRYAMAYKQGAKLPPVKVAKIGKGLLLIDGWHRIEALKQSEHLHVDVEVLEGLEPHEAQWEAARANLLHGLPLKSREMRAVFKAFIQARRHRQEGGGLKSYREIAEELGGVVSYSTIRNWMRRDFPSIFRAMGADHLQHEHGGLRDRHAPTMAQTAEDHLANAFAAFRGITDPDERTQVVDRVEKMLDQMWSGDVEEPLEFDFSETDF